MGERVLVVGPAFHGYADSLGRALERNGHEVTVHPYDANPSVVAKARTKLVYELPGKVGLGVGARLQAANVTARAATVVEEARPDVLVVIRGDLLQESFWEAASRAAGRTVLWLYDELRRMDHEVDTLRRVDTLVTYSPNDAAALNADGIATHCIANAFDDTFTITPRLETSILFVGARYPNRQRAVERLIGSGVPVLAVGRDWSHHPFDRLRTWQLSRPKVPALRDVSRAEAYDLMAGAAASLNVHTDQDGFTMRTFEACGAGGLQLIDRPDVEEFYEPGTEVLVFRDEEEMVDLARRALAEPGWARSIGAAARRRTLAEHTFVHRARELERVWG